MKKKRKSPKPRVEMTCKQCGASYTIRYSKWIKGEGIYCSQKCKGESTRNRIEVQCDTCGKTMLRRPHRINDRIACSKECNAAQIRGEGNPRWKGGHCSEGRHSVEYKEWRVAQLKKADYTCSHCQVRGGKLQVHHILSYTRYPDAALAEDNGAVLCEECHKEFHRLYGVLKFTDEDYFTWLR